MKTHTHRRVNQVAPTAHELELLVRRVLDEHPHVDLPASVCDSLGKRVAVRVRGAIGERVRNG